MLMLGYNKPWKKEAGGSMEARFIMFLVSNMHHIFDIAKSVKKYHHNVFLHLFSFEI